jgi:hypothetical protein
VRRAPVERIRCNVELQASMLRLAITELLAPHPDGCMSGNITLVKRAAELCSYQANVVDLKTFSSLEIGPKSRAFSSSIYSSLSFEANRLIRLSFIII